MALRRRAGVWVNNAKRHPAQPGVRSETIPKLSAHVVAADHGVIIEKGHHVGLARRRFHVAPAGDAQVLPGMDHVQRIGHRMLQAQGTRGCQPGTVEHQVDALSGLQMGGK